ncbi:hypothetical protein L3X38_045421 [Prunus dulcis]|uniref:Uncharacterized protein n=1 Tax=Prunus dulcis TaxID=3755 RepID=A0AAD4V0C2_PRUDU|nr:hypothetical protein L3X38_045421 [Prunus dulcis]
MTVLKPRFSPSPQKLHDQPTSSLHHRHHTPSFLAAPVPLELPYFPLRFSVGPSIDPPAWLPESTTEQAVLDSFLVNFQELVRMPPATKSFESGLELAVWKLRFTVVGLNKLLDLCLGNIGCAVFFSFCITRSPRHIPLLLDLPFLTIDDTLKYVQQGTLTLRVQGESIEFKVFEAVIKLGDLEECDRIYLLDPIVHVNYLENNSTDVLKAKSPPPLNHTNTLLDKAIVRKEFGQQPKQYLEEVAFFTTSAPPKNHTTAHQNHIKTAITILRVIKMILRITEKVSRLTTNDLKPSKTITGNRAYHSHIIKDH